MPGDREIQLSMTDYQLVSSALYNKGMGFTHQERDEFNLHGLIPPKIGTLEEQKTRAYKACQSKASNLEKYIYLRDLQDSNETLFYAVLTEHLDELMPIVYTPTVGLGCQQFSHIYRRPRGLFISYPFKDHMEQMLSNPRFKDVEVIVASDGERILGLGDQGAGGMGIAIGKLALYSACAGIHPRRSLPIMLDVGTDNPHLINDPLYIGWQHERLRGDEYYAFIDQFVQTVKKQFPNILLQWEDFAKNNATHLLHKYQDELCTFNDDVQGTAAVVLATLLAAVDVSKVPLEDHRIVIAGAGSAGCGIANLLLEVLKRKGIDENRALQNFFLVDRTGLLHEDLETIFPFQKKFCKKSDWMKEFAYASLEDVVEGVKATVLIGVSGQPGLFTQKIVEKMAQFSERPIIFPLSNPDTCAEAIPANLALWSQNRALIGTGSPFEPITKDHKPFRVDQTNNAYIFPGLGLGTIAIKAKKVTTSMFIIAAETLAKLSPARHNPSANLLPPLTESRKIAFEIAMAVANEAIESGLAEPKSREEMEKRIRHKMWEPVYQPYRRVDKT